MADEYGEGWSGFTDLLCGGGDIGVDDYGCRSSGGGDVDIDNNESGTNVSGDCNAIDPNRNLPPPPPIIGSDGKIRLQVWQVFEDYKSFGNVLVDYCIQEGFEIFKKKYDIGRVKAICKGDGCPWKIHASKSPDGTYFVVKSLNPKHTCQQVRRNKNANPTWIARKLLSTLKYDVNTSIESMKGQLLDRFGIEVDKKILWKARAKAKEMLEGSHAESFKKLRCYAHVILEKNPGSFASIKSDVISLGGSIEVINTAPPQFRRIFICYQAVVKGFLDGCRPFFGLDGCHLKGPFKGILLVAVAIDANLQFYPLAYGIVEIENKETWKWFIDQLKEAIGPNYHGVPWTIMSDRQKGIEIAIPDMPGSAHRFCAFHLKNNFKKKFGDVELIKLFWKAANTANFNEFLNIMAEIKAKNVAAYEYLKAIEAKHWSRSKFDRSPKVGLITNNHTESFNSWLDELRSKPPIQLLEGLREEHTKLLYARHVATTRWKGNLPPKVTKLINDLSPLSRRATVHRVGQYEFQVEHNTSRCMVRLDERYCDCELWQVRGIPCVHALACILTVRGDEAAYCSHFFSVENWKRAYDGTIHPIPSMNMWPRNDDLDLLPPPVRTLPGRPKKHRRRDVGEKRPRPQGKSSTKKCSNCLQYGHNKTSCVKETAYKPPPRCHGRPKKQNPLEEVRASSTVRFEQAVGTSSRVITVFDAY